MQMDVESLEKAMRQEWDVISAAPVMFIAAVLIVSALLWKILSWRYAGIIENKQSLIDAFEKRQALETVAITSRLATGKDRDSKSDHPIEPPSNNQTVDSGIIAAPATDNSIKKDMEMDESIQNCLESSVGEIQAMYDPSKSFAEGRKFLSEVVKNRYLVEGTIVNIGQIGGIITFVINSELNNIKTPNIAFDATNHIDKYPSAEIGSSVKFSGRIESIDAITIIFKEVNIIKLNN